MPIGAMILVIDNYDSFTFNLVQYLGEMGQELKVYRNDAITLDEESRPWRPERIVISPGPGRPENSGIIIQAIRRFSGRIPILGVCLGHQAIGAAFGGRRCFRSADLCTAKPARSSMTAGRFSTDLRNPFRATRYHSLVVSPERSSGLPGDIGQTEDGVIMGLRHRSLPVEGVQFHPESILTDVGKKLLANFLGDSRRERALQVQSPPGYRSPVRSAAPLESEERH